MKKPILIMFIAVVVLAFCSCSKEKTDERTNAEIDTVDKDSFKQSNDLNTTGTDNSSEETNGDFTENNENIGDSQGTSGESAESAGREDTNKNPDGSDDITGTDLDTEDTGNSGTKGEEDMEQTLDTMISEMSLDEKISQMIIPAFRTWNEKDVTNLEKFPELKKALSKHQYGGIILYGANITGTAQVAKLVGDLQENNLENSGVKYHIPYFTTIDEEGGIVNRIDSGTRMTGNMAIGATGADALVYAISTGEVIGEELASLGFNVDYAPVVDVNNNPSNPVIGTRSFSDDPALVSTLGIGIKNGLMKSNVIATFKHFPGHGDTGKDSHIDTPSVEKTYEEINSMELIPFREAVKNGADMIMTAHITYPKIDEEVTYGDGKTLGYYPATMSKKIITDILRDDIGFEGVVVTDALEMDAIRTSGLVPGETGSVEYGVNIAEKVINADVDMLLLPLDMNDTDAVTYYDEYIDGIAGKVADGTISEEQINRSVKRILRIKQKYGILLTDVDKNTEIEAETGSETEDLDTVGSAIHHATEKTIAEHAVTLVKNEDNVLPLSSDVKNIVILSKYSEDITSMEYEISKLRKDGILSADVNVVTDYYIDINEDDEEELHFTKNMRQTITDSDVLIVISAVKKPENMENDSVQFKGVYSSIKAAHEGNGKVILLSSNLPYDAARYTEADAVLLAYMSAGLNMDPTAQGESKTDKSSYNANVLAALDAIFGIVTPYGHLPVNIPQITTDDDGAVVFSDELLYERGFGLTY